MYTSQIRWHGRSKLIGGWCCRAWGRLIRSPDREFQGDQLIIAGKLEAYYADGRAGASTPRRTVRISGFIDRRRSFHVVA